MPKHKAVQDTPKPVNHEELRALVDHLSTLFAAYDVRLAACEAALPVDPSVKEAADAMVVLRNGPGSVVRSLTLVDDEPRGTIMDRAPVVDTLGDPDE